MTTDTDTHKEAVTICAADIAWDATEYMRRRHLATMLKHYAATNLAAPSLYSSTNFVKCRGESLSKIVWQGRQWAVTTYGIEKRDGTYVIERHRCWDNEKAYGWVCHLSGKDWIDLPDFAEALRIARRVHKRHSPRPRSS